MKKIIAVVLTLSLIFSLLPAASLFADSSVKVDLKQAIEIAKKNFNFSTTGMEFSNGYSENPDGTKVWNMNWYSKNGTGGSFNVSVNAETGEIINMSQWDNNITTPSRIPKYTREEALKVAKALAEKLQPVKLKETKLTENVQNAPYYDKYSDTYNFNYQRLINGIEYQYNGITVNVDKNTLKVRSFNVNWEKTTFPDASKAIGLDAAKKIFGEQLGIELAYTLIYPSGSTEPKVILVYTLKNGNRPIDALTGELINNTYYGPMYGGDMKMDRAAMSSESLTPQEQKVVDNSQKYITKEAALEAVKKYITIEDKYKLSNANLYGGYGNESAAWNLNWNYNDNEKNYYAYISASVDAITGELKNYYISNSDIDKPQDGDAKYTKEQAKEIAISYLKQLQPDKYAQSEYRDVFNEYESTVVKPANYSFNFIRKVNGIAFPSNNLYVTVNAYTGQITNYSYNWSTLQFPAATGTISLEDAYKVLYAKTNFAVKYIKYNDYKRYGDTGITKLAYVLDNFGGLIDAKTGLLIDYNGNPIVETKDANFTDIKGNKAEKDIKLLVEMGIIDSAKTTFAPDSKILQKDFIKLLVRALQPYYYPMYSNTTEINESEYDSYYEQAISRKIISANAKNPNAAVTKQDAAKMLVKAIGVGFVAGLPDIYNVSYKDAASITQANKGYVVIATKLGILDAPGNTFSPNKQLTKGDTATILVNYMKVDTTPKE